MEIHLQNTGKRFNREWIFRHFNKKFLAAGKYAITGNNGSGKSTLLQVIAGALMHNEGTVQYVQNNTVVAAESTFKHISIAAPYLELIEEMTAKEFLLFHHSFKPMQVDFKAALQTVQLEKAADRQIRYFSSGMKQRLKLAQAFLSVTPVLLLDEPTTNLDAEGIALYDSLIKEHTLNRLVIISSNDVQEYEFCNEVIAINDYK